MEELTHDIITKLIEKDIDLFKFIELDEKYIKSDIIFTDKYKSGLKRAYKRNSIKYHPDKSINVSIEEKNELERKFNLNQLIYKILRSENEYIRYKEYKELLSIKSHDTLKKSKISDIDIKNMIKEASNGKTYEELSLEKDKQHGYKRDEPKIDMKEMSKKYNNMIMSRDKQYIELLENSKRIEILDKDTFNKEFNNKIERKTLTEDVIEKLEIQPYNSISTLTVQSGSFDYQNNDYSNIFDPKFSEIENSFKLLSADIPNKIKENKSLEDKMREYEQNTLKLQNMIKEKKEID